MLKSFHCLKMLSQSIFNGIRVLRFEARRSIGIIAPATSKAPDPIQQLFLDKVHEYKQGGKMVDASPEIECEMKTELERAAKQFDKTDMTKFQQFKFPDVKIYPITTA